MIAATVLAVCAGFLAVLIWLISGWSAPHPEPRPVWLEVVRAIWPLVLLSAVCFGTAAYPRVWTAWLAAGLMGAITVYSWQLGGVQIFLICLLLSALCLAGAVSVTVGRRR